MLNESTIILLGGRDKLGNAVPNIKESDLIKKETVSKNVFGPSNPNEVNYGSGRAYAFTREFYKPLEEDFDTYTRDPEPIKLSYRSKFGFDDIKAEKLGTSDHKAGFSFQKPKIEGNLCNLKSMSGIKLEKVVSSNVKDKENATSSNMIPKSEVQSPLKAKSIQFSSSVETRVIDSTKEGYEQSKEARKKPAFTVQRIIIPSRIPKQS